MIKKSKILLISGFILAFGAIFLSCSSTSSVDKTPTTDSTSQNESENKPNENDLSNFYPKDMSKYKTRGDKIGSVINFQYHSTVFDADRKAQIYIPADYDESIKYPVIYLIHGIGCDSTQWVSMGCAAFFDTFISKGELKPFIAVFPSVIPADGLDKVTLSDKNIQAFKDFVQELTEDLEPSLAEKFSISLKREDTAICGLSMGGMEALRVGFTYLDKFNYIGSFSAAPTLEMNLLTTEGSEFTPDLVLICSGNKDTTVGNNPFNYHMALLANGVPHLWYEHPGGSHAPDVWNLGLVNFLERLSGGFTE